MEKATQLVRLITALLLGVEAGLRVAKQVRETQAEARPPDFADVGSALRKMQGILRQAAERAGKHNDAPGSL